ncbi:MAG: hypothetical protein P4M00_15965 [Azospirillaceae bacterium]|nr:hypothetical protein [Azospirillaceae bacterium]
MKRLLLLTLVGSALTGCAAPVLMKDPATGQIAQCYAQTNLIRRYYERDKCVESYEKLGWTKVDDSP